MNVNLFGGIYAPSTPNYTLKRTAKDFDHMSSPKTLETLKDLLIKDFFINNLLNLTSSEELGIQLL